MPPDNDQGGQGGASGAGASGASGQQGQGQQGQQGAQGGQQQQQQAPTRPDYIPEAYWDATKGAVKAEDLGKVLTAHEARTKGAIADWDKHELKTAIKDSKGNQLEVKRDSPLVKALGDIVKARGWTNDDVQPLVDMIATTMAATSENDRQEYLSIGGGDETKADQRQTAMVAKAVQLLGTKGADGKVPETDPVRRDIIGLLTGVTSKAQFETLEKLITAASGAPAGANLNGAGGEVPLQNRMYSPDYLKSVGAGAR